LYSYNSQNMRNYMDGSNKDTFRKLNVKIFYGDHPTVESEIKIWLKEQPVEIEGILQSQNFNDVVITIFYYELKPSQFIDEGITMSEFRKIFLKHIEDFYGINPHDLIESILDKQ